MTYLFLTEHAEHTECGNGIPASDSFATKHTEYTEKDSTQKNMAEQGKRLDPRLHNSGRQQSSEIDVQGYHNAKNSSAQTLRMFGVFRSECSYGMAVRRWRAY